MEPRSLALCSADQWALTMPKNGGWLKRSGQFGRVRAAGALMVGAIGTICFSWVGFATGLPRAADSLLLLAQIVAIPTALVAVALRTLVRCRVCGLRLGSCAQARDIGRTRVWLEWIPALEACPQCGDDGSASPESQGKWLASGLEPERVYWSLTRIVLAVFITIVFLVGGIWCGGSWRPGTETGGPPNNGLKLTKRGS